MKALVKTISAQPEWSDFPLIVFSGLKSARTEPAANQQRPIDLLAAEVSYIDFGRAFNGINYADTNAVGAFALAFLPIPLVDVYGKVGLAEWRTDAQSPGFGFHRTGANVAYGAGVGTNWGDIGVRLEYERYEVSHSNDMGMASIGVVWAFL